MGEQRTCGMVCVLAGILVCSLDPGECTTRVLYRGNAKWKRTLTSSLVSRTYTLTMRAPHASMQWSSSFPAITHTNKKLRFSLVERGILPPVVQKYL